MQYSQKNFVRIIGNEQKNNGQNFWEILERIIGKISSIIGAGLTNTFWALKAFFCSNIKSVLQRDSQLQAVKAGDVMHGFVCIPTAIKITRI